MTNDKATPDVEREVEEWATKHAEPYANGSASATTLYALMVDAYLAGASRPASTVQFGTKAIDDLLAATKPTSTVEDSRAKTLRECVEFFVRYEYMSPAGGVNEQFIKNRVDEIFAAYLSQTGKGETK